MALLDTSFLLAAAFERDQNHLAAARAMREIKSTLLIGVTSA
jgi:predicted nucleic acid-binding protein